ncbi:MAG: hypothetical protein ACXWF0_09310 [Usitatibacter sp.]
MLMRHVALVSEKSSVTMRELSGVAAALQKQAGRDLGPIWNIEATVTAFERLEDLPLDYWPVVIQDDIGDPQAAGYHEDKNGQPFALIQYSQGWTLTASHEVLEMLVDPFGRRLVAGQSPIAKQGRVRFLVEVCDPSEAEGNAYHVNGVLVSDFYTPHYFDPVKSAGVRYSFTNAITEPKQVLKGGYLSWYDSETKSWWQRSWFGTKPSDQELKGFQARNGNLREALDHYRANERAKVMGRGDASRAPGAPRGARRTDDSGLLQAPGRAAMLRETIAAVCRRK